MAVGQHPLTDIMDPAVSDFTTFITLAKPEDLTDAAPTAERLASSTQWAVTTPGTN